ncbi:uncharacterized protein LY89DRAFT_396785 [Mollisia scopiformis]|uniref:Clr5 domain-containing protein n=1 Tax=Mollisia scopiformis TaxID=149040 RepID=A0A132B370_MOLSC|nr:uncharacterized protein LY89DRAFT_396785 [Mollisia scopiformis]KUJ06781.1 hypothetical protein LY89DRAFT_396785 [Mollisia scopiformis]
MVVNLSFQHISNPLPHRKVATISSWKLQQVSKYSPLVNSSNMETGQSQNNVTAAFSFIPVTQPHHPQPQGFSKKDWEDLKPVIQTQYLEHRQTIGQLSQYLKENHGYKPTKRQLLSRISAWGFEKNVKKTERRQLIQKHRDELENSEFAPRNLRGRTIKKEKLIRWVRQEEGEVGGSMIDDSDEVILATMEAPKEPTTENTSVADNQSAPDNLIDDLEVVSSAHSEHYPFGQGCIDVIGSPRLTGLFGLLTIEEFGGIPDLDLSSNNFEGVNMSDVDLMDLCNGSDSDVGEVLPENDSRLVNFTSPAKTSRLDKLLETWTQSGLQFELYPFPESSNRSFDTRYFTSNTSALPKMSESECLTKFRKLRHLAVVEVSNLAGRMMTIAKGLYMSRDFASAERWYRRIVTAKQKIRWHKPEETLQACLAVLSCLRHQGRYSESQQLHNDLHAKIEVILGNDHRISIRSQELKAEILYYLGHSAESEAIDRQILQIQLSSFGVRHAETLTSLGNLGSDLVRHKRCPEAQRLLEAVISFRYQAMKAPGAIANNELGFLYSMTCLASI